MELGSVFVQPCLPGYMIDPIPVTVVAGCRVQAELTFQGMTIIADRFKGRIGPMLVLAMNPAGFLGGLAAVGAEMTIIAAGDIVIAL